MRLRSMGVRAIAVLRAMEVLDRAAFLAPACAGHAHRDIALPIGCGQTMAEPSFIARKLEALACTRESRVLEVGSGSGYVTVLLGQLAGAVHGVERFRALAEAALTRTSALDLPHVTVAWDDGLAVARQPYDRILLHVAVPAPPADLLERLMPGGIMVCSLVAADGRQDLVRLTRVDKDTITAARQGASRLQLALRGRSQVL